MLFRHPRGLVFLFTIEMWERFSFYAMRALLVLYMTARVFDGGLGWTKGEALSVYAVYLGAAYLMPLVGGYMSDRFLGQRRSAMIGASMMAIGHFLMAFNNLTLFYAALSLVASGNGFFKPCLTSILGQLYDDADESQRDSAYSLFYMGINIGAALSGIVSGYFLVNFGFDAGFAAAGVAMVVGLSILWWGKNKFLGSAGIRPLGKTRDNGSVPVTVEEKKRFLVIGFLFLVIVFFIIAWEQIGGLVPLFIEERINRQVGGFLIPTPCLASIDPFLLIFLTPIASTFWAYLGKKNLDPFVGTKMGIGCFFLALSFVILVVLSSLADNGASPHCGWIFINKFMLSLGELMVIPISWAAVTRLSPERYVSRVMGFMLAGSGVGSYLAGLLGSYVDQIGSTVIFKGLAIELLILSALCFLLNGTLKKMVL